MTRNIQHLLAAVLISIILFILLPSCTNGEYKEPQFKDGYVVKVIDSCEYILSPYGGSMVHKGNCKNSFHYK